jgi:hypothetical protein
MHALERWRMGLSNRFTIFVIGSIGLRKLIALINARGWNAFVGFMSLIGFRSTTGFINLIGLYGLIGS